MMLFGVLPLLLVGLGLTFLLDSGAEDDPPPESETLSPAPGDDLLDMANTEAETVNASEGDDTISSGETDAILLRLRAGEDTADLSNGLAEVYGRAGDDTITMTDSSLSPVPGLGNDTVGGIDARIQACGGTDLMTATRYDDIVDGGDGQDDVIVVRACGSPDDPAVITDFGPNESDLLSLTITPEFLGAPRDGVDFEVERQLAADGSGVEILVNGTVYVKLDGITTLEGWNVGVRENVS